MGLDTLVNQERMTKNEMMGKYYTQTNENNYKEACNIIREAMQRGEKYVLLPGKNSKSEFNWCATYETISKLKDDGYDVDVVWDPWEYWSIEWGY